MNALLRGMVAGAAGTAAHSLVMFVGDQMGWLYRPPPKGITARLLEKTGIDETPHGEGFTAAWVSAHVGYGVASGVLLDLVRRLLPKPPVVSGALFGVALWAISYFELLPGLGLHAPPQDKPQSQNAVMVAAHIAYGITAVEVDDVLRGPHDEG